MIRLSYNLDENTPSYGNRNKLIVNQKTITSNDFYVTESEWHFTSNHLGTHIDTPKHFIKDGLSLTDFPTDFWIFNKVECINIPMISGELIEFEQIITKIKNPLNIELLLIRTGYQNYRGEEKYWNDNPGISSSCSNLLRNNFPSLRGIGFDFISLTSYNFRDDGKQSHFNLLKDNSPFIIIEDMKLSVIESKIEKIIVAPLFIDGADGSMVTVFSI